MASSLSAECTPLKHQYDACFNAWFEGYLEPAVAHKNKSDAAYADWSKRKAAEYEEKCGKVWAAYRDCVQNAIKERGVDDMLAQARKDHPLDTPTSGPSR